MRKLDYTKFRKRMQEQHVQQKDLARILGISEVTVSNRLRQNLPFSLNEITLIKFYFDMTTKEVIRELTEWDIEEEKPRTDEEVMRDLYQMITRNNRKEAETW
ncbi:helix-turn-helix domain-containing protein [Fastidiosipila sanguinis]|uniref:HTH cro/C1-type domain-containing protein n=1 Tax=Fastidiosipila sanguinis TaxID=236753 RepID=A0A2S0KP88_9FIRM|nr:hypothetical protein [Fastidiosipila sanguinis]AVM42850.1 hypothetical protein C5Q98_06330 [Fastidiosipila sanguinis]